MTLETGNAAGVACQVTEFIEGARQRQSRPQALRRQLDVAEQIAEALVAVRGTVFGTAFSVSRTGGEAE